MGDGIKYEIAQSAYVKVVLHALKHLSSPVNGLLLGLCPSDYVVLISDAVPLSHSPSHIGLLPSLELALLQVEERFGAEGPSVVGYYHANERCDDRELSGVARRIGDHISRYFPRAPVLLIDNKKLENLPKEKGRDPVLQVLEMMIYKYGTVESVVSFTLQRHDKLYTKDSKNWSLAGSDGTCELKFKEPAANVVLLDYISSEKFKDIVDFDDHLDDISKDWLNSDIFK